MSRAFCSKNGLWIISKTRSFYCLLKCATTKEKKYLKPSVEVPYLSPHVRLFIVSSRLFWNVVVDRTFRNFSGLFDRRRFFESFRDGPRRLRLDGGLEEGQAQEVRGSFLVPEAPHLPLRVLLLLGQVLFYFYRRLKIDWFVDEYEYPLIDSWLTFLK